VSHTAPRLRLAYAQLDWGNTQFTFGQDWMKTFAPLNPTSLAHVSIPSLSSAGNLWTRIAQLRLDHKFETSGAAGFMISGALLRPFGADYEQDLTQFDAPGSAERSRAPFVQGRFAVTAEMDEDELATGLGFHYGREESTISDDDLTSWGVAWDGYFPFNPIIVSGELFWGENLNMFYSSAGVADRHAPLEFEQRVIGGWVQLGAQVNEDILLNVGYGVEDIDDDDLTRAGAITQNSMVFGNLIYNLSKNLRFAFETGYIETEYHQAHKKDNINVDFALQYIFK
jgi:hypothetical protein